ncbi:hypothetical protein CK203_091838 [Vitis vinifera]|uniref:Uncharacterized protein n=1 Tax=Vitis vinifera TaxID=29760 RepID=A0A438BM18_VITVI|nr:hypothetical protein CK203_091838 [Vitis vinifera]
MKLQVDNRVLDLLQLECGGFSISCHFRNVEDDFVWVFTGVYDLVLMREKRISGMNWELSKGGGVKKCKIPFRFENMWLLTDGFKELDSKRECLFLLRRQRLKRGPLRIIRSGFYWKKLHGDKNLGNLVKRWRQEHQVFSQDGQCSCKKEFVNQGENKWGYSD